MEFVSGNIFIRPMGYDEGGLKPGEKVGGHTHAFDHTTIAFAGDWRVRKWAPDVDGKLGPLLFDFERAGPFHVLIEAHARHEFTFLGGAPVGHAYCVYAHRTPQGDVVQEQTGWPDAYAATSGPPWAQESNGVTS